MKNINPAQQQAIDYRGGHLLIVAGPGTGKTHTLIHRIAKIAEKLDKKQKILAITFTQKAAKEMQARLNNQGIKNIDQIFVGTFHQFCLSLLRQYVQATNLPSHFSVATTEEIEMFAKQLWPDQSRSRRKRILEEISRWKCSIFKPRDLNILTQNFRVYQEKLRENNSVDFDDLLLEAVNLLKANASIREEIVSTYNFVFVDEYQDINMIQHILLKTIAGQSGHLTAIGDFNQAIYGFRGADAQFFKKFAHDFPGAVQLNLIENYRSTANILEASGQVIAANTTDVPQLTANIYAKGHLTIFEAVSDKAEAEYVVHQIEKIVGGTSMFSQDSGRVQTEADAEYSFGDVAVFYRLNAQRRILEEAFLRSGIPFQVSGDKSYETEEPLEFQLEKVQLMTLHASKGLEFPVVFITGCEENLLPLNLKDLTSDEKEERRLFYVGMTRAKQRLYLLHAQRRYLFGKSYNNPPSPFFKDIKEELKQYEKSQHTAKKAKNKADLEQLDLFA